MDTPHIWPDQKICHNALFYINKHVDCQHLWLYTVIGSLHPELEHSIVMDDGELAIVSSYISAASWYIFSTRRILGSYEGQSTNISAQALPDINFGNFKSRGKEQTGVMVLHYRDGTATALEYELGCASMAPIYADRFWWVKFPVLDKLRD